MSGRGVLGLASSPWERDVGRVEALGDAQDPTVFKGEKDRGRSSHLAAVFAPLLFAVLAAGPDLDPARRALMGTADVDAGGTKSRDDPGTTTTFDDADHVFSYSRMWGSAGQNALKFSSADLDGSRSVAICSTRMLTMA